MTAQTHAIATAPATEALSQVNRLQRSCACGGAAGASGKCSGCAVEDQLGLQSKLTLNRPGDSYEQEADRVADRVSAPDAPARTSPVPVTPLIPTQPVAQRDEDEEELGQAKAVPGRSGAQAPRQFAERLTSESRNGRPLDAQARSFLEPRFGRDLGGVRLHTSSEAAALSRDIGARAFTHRNHIFFGSGQYETRSSAGRHLLAHEVTHTLQQGTASSTLQTQGGTAEGFFNNIGRGIAALFGAEPAYDDETLKAYLKNVSEIGGIENDYDSDNKAMFVARRITAKKDASGRIDDKAELLGQTITLETRKILIQEMQRGATLGGEEEAILDLMTSLEAPEILQLFEGKNALDASKLRGDIDGDNQVTLDRLLTALGLSAEGLKPRANFENCEGPERSAIQTAMGQAKADISEAIRRIEEDGPSEVVSNSFFLAFRVEEPSARHLSDMVRRLNAIRDGVGNVHYICDHGENAKSSCNEGSGGHAAFDVTGNGISICFMPKSDEDHENFAKEKDKGRQSRLLIHEAAHFFLGVEDKGYFGSECEETERAESCLNGTREECGTSGRPADDRFDNADSYECLVYFLGQLAKPRTEEDEEKDKGEEEDEEKKSGEEIIAERAQAFKGGDLGLRSRYPGDSFEMGGAFSRDEVFINEPQKTEYFAVTGEPDASGFSFRWSILASGQELPLVPEEYRGDSAAFVPEATKKTLRAFHEKDETRATVRLLTTPYQEAPDRSKVETKLTVMLTDKEARFL